MLQQHTGNVLNLLTVNERFCLLRGSPQVEPTTEAKMKNYPLFFFL